MHATVKTENGSAFDMSIANAFAIVWNLARIVTCVVSVRTACASAFIIYLRLPLHVTGRIELANFEFRLGIKPETANRAVHNVTGDPLDAVNEIHIIFSVQRAIIDLAIANIREVKALLHVSDFIGIILEHAIDELEGIWSRIAVRHIDPAWAVRVIPLAPWECVIIVVSIHRHGQAETAKVVNAGSAMRFFLGPTEGWQEERCENGNDGDDDQQFDQSESKTSRGMLERISQAIKVSTAPFHGLLMPVSALQGICQSRPALAPLAFFDRAALKVGRVLAGC